MVQEPNMFISRRSQQLGLTKTTTLHISQKDLVLKAFKIQIISELKPLNHQSLKEKFIDRVMLRNIIWRSNSCYSTVLDYYKI